MGQFHSSGQHWLTCTSFFFLVWLLRLLPIQFLSTAPLPPTTPPSSRTSRRSSPPSPTPTSTESPTTTATPTSRRARHRTPAATWRAPSPSLCLTAGSRRPPTRPTTPTGSWPRSPTPGRQSSPRRPLVVTLERPSLAMPPLHQHIAPECFNWCLI